ncbi:MAG TPA: zinc metalloprotease HtpX [Armatimonadota bacterium]|jgi:heat shock protein HtpX|nr:zinc metalloprotease HtpX [Armatimonadota bacterium]HOM72633.1 zinc metalloprotease HtpX [Armatimonadota bacterium]HOP80380.1 zinc metalloprotease HtpX [Armatimonadota bacterium]
MNWTKTFLLMGTLTALLVLIGKWVAGTNGMILFLGLAGVMNFVSYWYSDKIVLKMYGAQPITETDSPQLYGMVERLTQQAGLPMPKLYLMNTDMPNAFATGRNPDHAAVAVTSGLMRILDRDEVEGVIAHELAHVKNRDILIGTIAATMAGAIMMIANWARFAAIFGGMSSDDDDGGSNILVVLIVSIVAAFAAFLVQMAISRSREFQADRTGAEITGHPLGLANALLKLERGNQLIQAEPVPATAHMFIINPLKGMFSTHPSTEDRVARLQMMAQEMPAY